MRESTTLSSKFQISIPKAVREQLHLHAGQQFVFMPKGAGLLLMPVPSLDTLAGLAEGANTQDYRQREDRF